MVMMMTSSPHTNTHVDKLESIEENELELREERIDDVVYHVTLRKTRRGVATSSGGGGLVSSTRKVYRVKAASRDKLVSVLCRSYVTPHDDDDDDDVSDDDVASGGDASFVSVMLETYRKFASPDHLLDRIFVESKAVNEANNGASKRRKLNRSIDRVLKTWSDKFFTDDFYRPDEGNPLLRRLLSLAQLRLSSALDIVTDDVQRRRDVVGHVRSLLQRAAVKGVEDREKMKMTKGTLSPKSSVTSLVDLHDDMLLSSDDNKYPSLALLNGEASSSVMTSSGVAEQLCVRDARLFLALRPHLVVKSGKSGKRERSACVQATIDHFNKVVWVVWATLLCPNLSRSHRVKLIIRWIEIATICEERRNFSSTFAIASTLGTHAIQRLVSHWQRVPDNLKHNLTLLQRSSCNSGGGIQNEGGNKKHQQQRGTPATVPYLGHVLTEINFMHAACPDRCRHDGDVTDEMMINFDKCRREHELIHQLRVWQAACLSLYRHPPVDHVFDKWFRSIAPVDDEKQAIALSEQIEPPVTSSTSPSSSVNEMEDQQHRRNSSPLSAAIFTSGETLRSSIDTSALSSRSSVTSLTSSHQQQVNTSSSASPTHDDGRTLEDGSKRINVTLVTKEDNEKDEEERKKESKLDPNRRAKAIVRELLQLFHIDSSRADDFSLNQTFPTGRVLTIPADANVFYAMNSSEKEFNFVLLERGAEIKLRSSVVSPGGITHSSGATGDAEKKHQRNSSAPSSGGKSPIRSILSQITGSTSSGGGYTLDDGNSSAPSSGWFKNVKKGFGVAKKKDSDPARGSKTLPRPSNSSSSKSWIKFSPKFMRKPQHRSLSEFESSNDHSVTSSPTSSSSVFANNDDDGDVEGDDDVISSDNKEDREKRMRNASLWSSDPCLLDSCQDEENISSVRGRPQSQVFNNNDDEVPRISIERSSGRRRARRSRNNNKRRDDDDDDVTVTIEDEEGFLTRL